MVSLSDILNVVQNGVIAFNNLAAALNTALLQIAGLGDYLESVVSPGSAVALVTVTPKNVTSISLPPGDWDVNGLIYYLPAVTTSMTAFLTCVSLVTDTLDITPGRLSGFTIPATVSGGSAFSTPLGPQRFTVTTQTTVFLVAQAAFTVSTMTAYGIIRARKWGIS